MELDFLSVAGLSVLALAVWQVKARIDMHKKDPSSSLPLPPGSFGLPIIGETISLIRSGFDPTPWYKKYGGICKTSMLGRDKIAYLMEPELINEFFKKHKLPLERSSNPFGESFLKDSVIQVVGKEHKYQRSMLFPAFTPKNMRRYVLRTQNMIQSFMEQWEEAGTFDAKKEIKEMAFTLAAEFFLGVKRDMTPRVQDLFDELSRGGFAMIYKDWPGTQYRKTKRAQEELLAFIEDIITQRRKEAASKGAQDDDDSATDPLEQMLNQRDEEGNSFPADKMAMTALVLIFAGFDTTKSSLIAITHKLIEYPEIRKKLRAEVIDTIGEGNEPFTLDQLNSMEYLDRFLAEVFRTMPVFLIQPDRQTKQTVEVGGYQIPKGWYVSVQRHVVSQNDRCFERPEEFNPDREHSDYVVSDTGVKTRNISIYGFGPYKCLGEHFAQLERKVFTVLLLRQFEPILESKEMPQMSFKTGFMTVEPEFEVSLRRLRQ